MIAVVLCLVVFAVALYVGIVVVGFALLQMAKQADAAMKAQRHAGPAQREPKP